MIVSKTVQIVFEEDEVNVFLSLMQKIEQSQKQIGLKKDFRLKPEETELVKKILYGEAHTDK